MDAIHRILIANFPELFQEEIKPSNLAKEPMDMKKWQSLITSVRPFLTAEIKRLGLSTDGKSEMDMIHEVVSFEEASNI